MSLKVITWVLEHSEAKLGQRLVLLALADHACDDGTDAYPSVSTIARKARMSERAVQTSLKALSGSGQVVCMGVSQKGTKNYTIIGPFNEGGEESAPPKLTTQGAKLTTSGGEESAPEPSLEPSLEPSNTSSAQARLPEQIGDRRWRVASSRQGKGPFVVDTRLKTCTCEAPKGRGPCRHLRDALEAETRALTTRKRAMRDAVWDGLAAVFGEPPERKKAQRGAVVVDIAEMLTGEHVEQTPERWRSEVEKRYAVLAREWGAGKVTLHALSENFGMAGKLLHGNGNALPLSDEERRLSEQRRRYTQA